MNQTTFALAIAVLSLSLGIVVALNNLQSPSNKRYAMFSAVVASWVSVNALSLYYFEPVANNFYTRLITPTSLVTLWSLATFAIVFPVRQKNDSPRLELFLLVPVAAIGIFAFTDLNVTQSVSPEGYISYEFGALYYPYVLTMLFLAAFSFWKLHTKWRLAKGFLKKQTFGVYIAFAVTILPAIVTGIILPLLNNYTYWNYSHFFIGFLPLIISYTIIRHQLFDIRTLLARFLAYLFSFGVIATIYGLSITFLNQNLFGGFSDTSELIVRSLIVTALVSAFPPVKKKFDLLTSQLFFHNPYEIDAALSDLSESLKGVLLPETVIQKCVETTSKYLRPDQIYFYPLGATSRVARRTKDPFSMTKNIRTFAVKHSTSVISATHSTKLTQKLKTQLDERGISVIATAKSTEGEILGLLILGPQKSGEIYRHQDLVFLELLSHTMGVSLSDARNLQQIKIINKSLKVRVQKATKSLRAMNTQLGELNEAKDDFISAASHQLKPQLAVAGGLLNILMDGHDGKLKEAQRKSLVQALTSVERMQDIVNHMLDRAISQPLAGDGNFKRVNLKKIIEEEISLRAPQLRRHNMRTQFTCGLKTAPITANATLVGEAFGNIYSNAIQYSPDGATVSIDLATAENEYVVRVTDSGIGVPKEDLVGIFDKFRRSSNAKRVRPSGTGLGLYFCKHVIETHGGRMISQSELDKGSTFGFVLPKAS